MWVGGQSFICLVKRDRVRPRFGKSRYATGASIDRVPLSEAEQQVTRMGWGTTRGRGGRRNRKLERPCKTAADFLIGP
jgi:hypothetical protein